MPANALAAAAAVPVTSQTDTNAADPSKTQRDKLKKATQDFEAVFIGMMLKEARKTTSGENSLFGGSAEAKRYQEMMDDQMAQHLSTTGAFGLAKTLYKQLEHTLTPAAK